MNSSQQSRHASHAGSWYVSSGKDLNHQLSNWLKDAQTQQSSALHAIISPHAGYSYCGSCAAYAYKQIQPENVKRVFILGPSHHVFLRDCALSPAITYETPLYNLTIDQEVYEELMSTGKFQKMSLQTDEDEHSIEMQLPYIAKAMESKGENGFTIVPVMVGSLDQSSEREYGKIFSKYIKDSSNLFVISSDFCHWGRRFNFTHYEEKHGDIYRYIETLDRQGMDLIENLDAEGFYQYLRKYRNTICGRHPIAVMLNAARTAQQQAGYNLRFQCRFLNYKQSSKCKNHNDNSVSYAAASLTRRDASSS